MQASYILNFWLKPYFFQFFLSMDAIKPDSIVWVKLGVLYGWWPAIFQPANFMPEKKEFPDLEIQASLSPELFVWFHSLY